MFVSSYQRNKVKLVPVDSYSIELSIQYRALLQECKRGKTLIIVYYIHITKNHFSKQSTLILHIVIQAVFSLFLHLYF